MAQEEHFLSGLCKALIISHNISRDLACQENQSTLTSCYLDFLPKGDLNKLGKVSIGKKHNRNESSLLEKLRMWIPHHHFLSYCWEGKFTSEAERFVCGNFP